MTPEMPTDPRKALEASLTALLLGELPDDQARFLRQTIATDPELANTYERLKKTIELVRETEARPLNNPPSQAIPPKLNGERRQELLQRFKTVNPPQFTQPVGRRASWLVPAAAAVVLLLAVAGALLPTLSRSKSKSMAQYNLRNLDNLEGLKRMGAAAESAADRSSRTRLREVLQNSGNTNPSAQGNEFAAFKQTTVPAIGSASPQVQAGAPAQTAIVLPFEYKPDLAPQPGQQVETVRIAGVGDVPVIKDQQEADNEMAALGKVSAVALRPAQVEAGKAGNAEVRQTLTLTKLDEAGEMARIEKLKENAASANTTVASLKKEVSERSNDLALASRVKGGVELENAPVAKPALPPSVPQPEVQTRENAFSTFSLNVSDVSFKLTAASLEKGVLPDPASIRSEEFINAFDYRDPEPPAGVPVAFASERARYPFAQNREVLRFSLKTAAVGRPAGQPLNLVLLLDNSGSMERADRVRIIREALRVLATQLEAQDTFSVVTFARTARLWVDGVPGTQAPRVADELSSLTPQGGTNLEDAMNLAYQTALRHYAANGINRVVLLTDGAANLGDTDPEALKSKVETNRKQGIALDCFGIGWEGYNDDLLEVITRHGDGRYGFVNTPEEAATQFASQLAGALHVAASDVKVQVEFNSNRVASYRQIGYARHQLTKEQFRDNTVDAAEIGAAESGNALYVIETNPQGDGPLATVRVRYKLPGTNEDREHEWAVPFTGNAAALEQSSPAMRLATTAGAFSEWLASNPSATEITCDRLLGYLSGVPGVYGADPRPQKLEWMIRQVKALSGGK